MPAQHLGEVEAQQTLNARVLAQLRADIVTCRLMPDERLPLETLRRKYQVGSSPIREALMRLEAEGLVRLEQNKGFRVSAASHESLLDLMRARVEIENTVLRWSIERGGIEWEADVLGAFHRLSRHSKNDPAHAGEINPAWSRAHRAFHAALVASCGSPTLLSIRESLFEKAERYVALSIVSKAPPRNDVAEHEQIMRAALARDAERALKLNRQHIERTAEKVARAMENAATRAPVQINGKRRQRAAGG